MLLNPETHPLDMVVCVVDDFDLEIEEVYGAGDHHNGNCLSSGSTLSSASATTFSSSAGTLMCGSTLSSMSNNS
jgi:hypothetical protein